MEAEKSRVPFSATDDFFTSKGKVLPKGLSEEALRKYRKVAEASQLLGKDTVQTQESRQKWIDEILDYLRDDVEIIRTRFTHFG